MIAPETCIRYLGQQIQCTFVIHSMILHKPLRVLCIKRAASFGISLVYETF